MKPVSGHFSASGCAGGARVDISRPARRAGGPCAKEDHLAALVPVPFGTLAARLLRELAEGGPVYEVPRRSFVSAVPGQDWSATIHGRRAATPFGPAAGPHTQLAQNVVASWLAGGRFLELKTVQVKDDLAIPRPCIDLQTVGFNVEWSQELSLAESLEEYVKGSMLVELLRAGGAAPGLDETLLDMSLGYDLAGIRSARVGAFLDGMRDASAAVDRLRREIPAPWAHLRDLPFSSRISGSVTLSTFHGCPPGEVERIVRFLLEEVGVDVVVKLNPTLLGPRDLRELLHERLGYHDLRVPDRAFAEDATWDEVAGMVERLAARAASLGRGLGVKLTNTLIVENHRSFFPASEKQMYLSGAPLHVLAVELVRRFRRAFGDRIPVSFSGGADALSFPDLAAMGLRPITACTDLLRPGGYARGQRWFAELSRRMAEVGAADLDELAVRTAGPAALEGLGFCAQEAERCRAALGPPARPERPSTPRPSGENCSGFALAPSAGGARLLQTLRTSGGIKGGAGNLRLAAGDRFAAWVSAARLRNTEAYADRARSDPRHAQERNRTPPRKVGSRLALFDCLTCDKCIPVCPNGANFSLALPPGEIPLERLLPAAGGRFTLERTGTLRLSRARQIANFADACNECGHCDVLCPEDGGPYVVKPRFFGSVASWREHPGHDGFALERLPEGIRVHGRFAGQPYQVERAGPRVRYRGQGFEVELDPADPAATATGSAAGPVDLAYVHIMERLRDAVTAAGVANWVSAGLAAPAT